MTKPNVAVVTPTISSRDYSILERAIKSVQWQTYPKENIVHVVCTDGFNDSIVEMNVKNEGCVYLSTNKPPSGTYGGYVRSYVTEYLKTMNIQYVCYLDDDNIFFPHFIEKNINTLQSADSCVKFAISQTIHMGPLPPHFGAPPAVVTGNPPVFRNIDTIQVFCELEAMNACGWETQSGNSGYYNDGYTYERLASMFPHIHINEILSIHL